MTESEKTERLKALTELIKFFEHQHSLQELFINQILNLTGTIVNCGSTTCGCCEPINDEKYLAKQLESLILMRNRNNEFVLKCDDHLCENIDCVLIKAIRKFLA